MEKQQDIPLDVIINTIQNISFRDATEEEFEEIPLPANSSYVPVLANKTSKTATSGSPTKNLTA